jgi:hypothetical protein
MEVAYVWAYPPILSTFQYRGELVLATLGKSSLDVSQPRYATSEVLLIVHLPFPIGSTSH